MKRVKQLPARREIETRPGLEQLLREKEEARRSDTIRIESGEAAPEEIQRQNSIFTREQIRDFKILNLEKVLLRLR